MMLNYFRSTKTYNIHLVAYITLEFSNIVLFIKIYFYFQRTFKQNTDNARFWILEPLLLTSASCGFWYLILMIKNSWPKTGYMYLYL